MQVVAVMAAPATADDLMNLIRKSGMIEEPRLEAYVLQQQRQGTMPTDARKLAGAMVRDGLMTYFQAEQFLLGKWRGFTVGKYKLLERIGIGGMGQVFLCEHLYMRRRVAIKILPPAKAEQPASLGRFYREARASGSLDHPNIVRTHDIDQDGNFHFLVMEYVDGASILELVKKTGPLDATRAAHYVRHAAKALGHANNNGLVHRDIKPGNIMVDRDGLVKILDMGLAKFFHDPNDQLTRKYDEHNVLGTADYVAPEQTLNSHEVDIRADIYALGATFYYMLAGHPPFPDGSVADKLLWHQTRPPTPIRQLRPDVPEGMAMILDKMMAKDLRNRYQLPEEVESALMPYTASPIPPPTANELPVLSPAAMEVPVQTAANSRSRDSDSLSFDMAQRPSLGGGSSAGSYPGFNPLPIPMPNEGSSSTVRGFAPKPPPDPRRGSTMPGSNADVQPGSPSSHEINPTADTGHLHGSAENTPSTTVRPDPIPRSGMSIPLNPPAFARPEAPNNDGPPPTTTRMTIVVLLAAFIGSALGMVAYSVFMGGKSEPTPAATSTEKGSKK